MEMEPDELKIVPCPVCENAAEVMWEHTYHEGTEDEFMIHKIQCVSERKHWYVMEAKSDGTQQKWDPYVEDEVRGDQ